MASSFEPHTTGSELTLIDTSNHGCITMAREITPTEHQWTENIELPQVTTGSLKKIEQPINEEILKIQMSNDPTKHQIVQQNMPLSTSKSKSLYIEPQKAASVNMAQIQDNIKTNNLIALTNVYKSPARTNALKPSKNQDYVWLDPKGKIVSPPTQDEYGQDCGINAGSQDTNVSLLINCNTSSNIRKVKLSFINLLG